MLVKIEASGPISHVTGKNYLEADLPDFAGNVIDQLKLKYPGINKLNFRISINDALCKSSDLLEENNKLKIISPFSGG